MVLLEQWRNDHVLHPYLTRLVYVSPELPEASTQRK